MERQQALDLLAVSEVLFDAATVNAAVDRVAAQISQRLGDAYPLVLCVMNGGIVFCGQLLTRLQFPLDFDYLHATRYGAKEEGGKLAWRSAPWKSVKDRTVLVVDDILDEGETLAHVKQRLLDMGAKEVVIVVFADKAIGKAKPIKPDLVGLVIPNRFVVGYGMDAYNYWRNLPGLWAIDNADLSG